MVFRGILPTAPSFSSQLGQALGMGIGGGASGATEFAQKMMLEKQKSKNLLQQTKQLEKVKIMETGLGTVNKMRELLESSGGFTSAPLTKIQSLYPGETQKNRAELEALGRSLIPLVAAGVPIRNQREFDEYRKIITDPDSSPAQFEGALNGIENILQRSLGEEGGEPKQEGVAQKKASAKSSEPMVKMTKNGKTKLVPKSKVQIEMQHGASVTK